MRLAFAMIVLFLSALASTGQTTPGAVHKKVSKSTIENLDSNAEVKRRKLSYRERITKLTYPDNRQTPTHTSHMIYEVLPPDRTRLVIEEKNEKGIHLSERIIIGYKQYSKEEDGSWKVGGFQCCTDPILKDSDSFWYGPALKDEYLYLGEQNLNGAVVDEYQVTTTGVRRSPNGDKFKRSVDKYWFDKSGRLIKEQIDTTNDLTRTFEQQIDEFEYDVQIKIEAPIQ